jgi:hypothetical protein
LNFFSIKERFALNPNNVDTSSDVILKWANLLFKE